VWLGRGEPDGRRKVMMNGKTVVAGMVAVWIGFGVAATMNAAEEGTNHAVQPQTRIEAWWFARHAEKIDEMKRRPDKAVEREELA